jgi:hypothetical protein
MKAKIDELATYCKNKNIRDYCRTIHEFKKRIRLMAWLQIATIC